MVPLNLFKGFLAGLPENDIITHVQADELDRAMSECTKALLMYPTSTPSERVQLEEVLKYNKLFINSLLATSASKAKAEIEKVARDRFLQGLTYVTTLL
jgi:hypothetical protein